MDEITLYKSALKEDIMKFRTEMLWVLYFTFIVNVIVIIAGFGSLILLLKK
jgi:hypothetical protein